MSTARPLIGFIGQGFIGKNYADDFERRGFTVVRYSLEEPYIANKDEIAACDFVFIAVPTPTTPDGFDFSIVRAGIKLVGKGKTAVIKSTIVPGTTKKLQQAFPDRIVVYSPEFLSEVTAAHDAAHPFSNIIGLTADSAQQRRVAEELHAILPHAPHSMTCTSTEAEMIKYSHNGSGYAQVIFFNLMYDLAARHGCDWTQIQRALEADPMISNRYARPVHKSGRGAGGHCFIKDVAALRREYEATLPDARGAAIFQALEEKNIELLRSTGKDLDLLSDVYGEEVLRGAVAKAEVPRLGSVGGDIRVLVCTEATDRSDPLLGFFHRWLEEFARNAERVDVISLGQGEYDLPANVHQHSLGKEHEHGSRLAKRLRYSLRFLADIWRLRKDYSTVLVHLSPEYIFLGALLWRMSGKRVGFWYNDRRGSWMTRIAIALSSVVFYSNEDSFAAGHAKARRIPMGVDTGMYDVPRQESHGSLLYLGRIAVEKKLERLIEAMTLVARHHTHLMFDVFGVASSSDATYAAHVREALAPLADKGRAAMRGSVRHAETPGIYASHDIFLHAGSVRGFNKTLYEAMAAGCVVVTAAPEMRGVVRDDLFVERADAEGYAVAIRAALGLSPAEREREREALKAYVRREHAISSCAPILLEMLSRPGGIRQQ